MLSGKREARYLVYSTGKGFYPIPGGFASRIKGITTVFFLALLTSKPDLPLQCQHEIIISFIREGISHRVDGPGGVYRTTGAKIH